MSSTRVITLPSGIQFSGFYYPELYRSLLQYFRTIKEKTGLTDENDYEVFIQFLSATALMGHYNNVHLDSLATEMFIDSAQLLASVRRMLKLMGVTLKSAQPAVATILGTLSTATSSDVTSYIPSLAEFETNDSPPIIYESTEDGIDLDRTDQVSYVYGLNVMEESSAGDEVSVIAGSLIITRGTGSWPTPAVGQVVEILDSSFYNNGSYEILERLDDTNVRVSLLPDGDEPAFQTEDTLSWRLLKFTGDFSTEANSGTNFTPFDASRVGDQPVAGDALYVAHTSVLMDQVDLEFDTVAAGVSGLWEYYDNERSRFNPLAVELSGSQLLFDLEPLLGTVNRTGSMVKIIYLKTGQEISGLRDYGTVDSVPNKNRFVSDSLFGQTDPSTDVEDYHITAEWVPFDNVTDGTSDLTADGSISWDIPQTSERSWNNTKIAGQEAPWLRYRVTSASSTNPIFTRVRVDGGTQYLVFDVTQGSTVEEQVVGSSTGEASQIFTLPETPYISDSETVEVDETGSANWIEYFLVETFIQSSSTDRHYTLEINENDEAEITFGDGTNGRIPPVGSNNVRATYRVGGEYDGNVGADQITVNADGVGGLSQVTNPRSADGWLLKEGGDEIDLERVKREAPARFRVRGAGVTEDDIERLAVEEFVDSSGLKPVYRAVAVEEGFGVKTVKLLVVGSGGNALSSSQLSDLTEYFNGDRYSSPPITGVLVFNHELTPINYEPAIISIETTVIWPGGSAELVKNALLAYLDPLAIDEEDGTTYLWDFGEQVSYSKLLSVIHDIDPAIKDVYSLTMAKGGGTLAASSVSLGANELPVAKTSTIAVTIQQQ
jgi:hypothetical protein